MISCIFCIPSLKCRIGWRLQRPWEDNRTLNCSYKSTATISLADKRGHAYHLSRLADWLGTGMNPTHTETHTQKCECWRAGPLRAPLFTQRCDEVAFDFKEGPFFERLLLHTSHLLDSCLQGPLHGAEFSHWGAEGTAPPRPGLGYFLTVSKSSQPSTLTPVT